MNTAKKRLTDLLAKIPLLQIKERRFIKECINAWNGYTDLESSYPHWQLRRIEKDYSLIIADIYNKYK